MRTKIKVVIISLIALLVLTVIAGPTSTKKEIYYMGEELIPSEKQWNIPIMFYEGKIEVNLLASRPVMIGWINTKGCEDWVKEYIGYGVVNPCTEHLPKGLVAPPVFLSSEVVKLNDFILPEQPGSYCFWIIPAIHAENVTTKVRVEMNLIKEPLSPNIYGLFILFEVAAIIITCLYAIPMRKGE